MNLRVGGLLVGVEYDSEATAAAIRERCRAWLVDEESGPRPAFGVRTTAVGFLRRKVGLVHHGAPVRYRAPDLDGAVGALGLILDGVARPSAGGELQLPLRVYTHGDQAVLVDVAPSAIVDERPLRSRGIREIPCWRAVIDLESSAVVTPGGLLPLVAIVVANPAAGANMDAVRRHLWGTAAGDRERWAQWLDESADRLTMTDDPARAVVNHLT